MKFLINKVLIKKSENQYDIEVYEEGEVDEINNDEFSDDYNSDELEVPEERETDEYIYSEQKNKLNYDESSGTGVPIPHKEESYYSGEDSVQIQPLQIDELENLYEEVHGGDRAIQIWNEPNMTSIIPQITHNSIFLNCYSEEIYDVLLEDLRKQYEHLIQNI